MRPWLGHGPADRTAATRMRETCPACLGPGRRLALLIDDRYRLFRCVECRTEFFRLEHPDVLATPRNVQSEYWEPHKFAFYGDETVQRAFARRYGQILDEVASKGSTAIESVLDVGCGTGNFLTFARQRGLGCVGIDLDPTAVREARRRGLRAYTVGELDAVRPDEQFDAVTLWDVIEHVMDPAGLLEDLLPRLRRDGVLLFETPDGGFPARRLVLLLHRLSRGRIDLTAPFYYWEHKIYFTEQGFRALMSRLSCDVISVRRETSVREKMSAVLSYEARRRGTWHQRVLAKSWPLLQRGVSSAGLGNKLLIIARKQEARPDEQLRRIARSTATTSRAARR